MGGKLLNFNSMQLVFNLCDIKGGEGKSYRIDSVVRFPSCGLKGIKE